MGSHFALHLAQLKELTRHRLRGVVGQIHTGISIREALGVEQMIQLSGQGISNLASVPILHSINDAHLLLQDFHQSIWNKAFVTREHVALEGDVALNQLLHGRVGDAFAQASPAHGTQPPGIVITTHPGLWFWLIVGTMLLHALFLSLPNGSHDLAPLLPCEEVGTKLALVEALVLCSVSDDIVVWDPVNDGGHVNGQKVGIHVDAAIVIDQSVSDGIRFCSFVGYAKELLWSIRNPLSDVAPIHQDG
mmetsp:Transcript_89587/g.109635  ORF Transcript_89587/g.109635 Transcript_89587/m.109635 type:complete len:248 (-) Transcript_89587:145-888(-)